jgi:4'-phosphopantetheinyl transferase
MAIESADVHVWAYSIDEPDAIVEEWGRLLARDEANRADRFVRGVDRGRWIVAHGVLRHLLARYCGCDPRALAFDRGAAGKPALARHGDVGGSITFNLAHSHGRALLAVGSGIGVGVDLEQGRADFDPLPIARRYFFGAELAAILAAPENLRRDAFFRHWVAKESVLKAQGVGLSFPLDRFGVTFDSNGTVARVQSQDPATLGAYWFVRMLPLEAGWHGAVTARGESWRVHRAT